MRSHVIRYLLAALLCIPTFASAEAATTNDPSGVWLTQSKDARIRVSRCGNALCGRVVWLREPIDKATGKAQLDDRNADPSLRGRPIVGIPLFIDMQAVGRNKWSGKIYNADDGKTYVSTVTLQPSGSLDVRGCMGAICAGEIWTH